MHETQQAIETLAAMLAYCRPHNTKSERRFIRRFLLPLGLESDQAGNLFKRIGDAPVLWSSHTDSVHRYPGNQRVCISGDLIKLPRDSKSNCLGADCATGVWLMREMILAKRPGLYVFHRAEECGGKGSEFIARKTPEVLEGIKHAIAFDRYGTKSVITHQGWGRCASDTFAHALGDAIGLGMQPDNGGVFTDTANYTDLIAECTNISVGYLDHHTAREVQNTAFAMELREAMLTLDTSKLPIERHPGEDDWRVDFKLDGAPYAGREESTAVVLSRNGTSSHARKLMRQMVSMNPDEICDLLEDYGFTMEDVAQFVYERGGAIPHELYQ
jgi:hypothetical protein